MKIFLQNLFFLSLFLLTACSSSYVVSSSGEDTSVAEFNESVEGEEAEIILSDSTVITATDLYLSADSLYWFNPETKLKTGAEKSEISKVMFTDMWQGGLEGAGFGLGFAAVVVLAGVSSGGRDSEVGLGNAILILGSAGILIGSITGVIIGHTNEYEFQNAEQQKNSDK